MKMAVLCFIFMKNESQAAFQQLGFFSIRLLVQRELLADLGNGSLDLSLGTLEVTGGHADTLGDGLHLLMAKTTGGDGGGADADAGGDGELLGVAGNGVLVQGDVVLIQTVLQLLAGDMQGTQVSQH